MLWKIKKVRGGEENIKSNHAKKERDKKKNTYEQPLPTQLDQSWIFLRFLVEFLAIVFIIHVVISIR